MEEFKIKDNTQVPYEQFRLTTNEWTGYKQELVVQMNGIDKYIKDRSHNTIYLGIEDTTDDTIEGTIKDNSVSFSTSQARQIIQALEECIRHAETVRKQVVEGE